MFRDKKGFEMRVPVLGTGYDSAKDFLGVANPKLPHVLLQTAPNYNTFFYNVSPRETGPSAKKKQHLKTTFMWNAASAPTQ